MQFLDARIRKHVAVVRQTHGLKNSISTPKTIRVPKLLIIIDNRTFKNLLARL